MPLNFIQSADDLWYLQGSNIGYWYLAIPGAKIYGMSGNRFLKIFVVVWERRLSVALLMTLCHQFFSNITRPSFRLRRLSAESMSSWLQAGM